MACSDSPSGPDLSKADLWLTVANAGDQGFLLGIEGPIESFTPAAGFQAFQQLAAEHGSLLVVAPVPLGVGEVRLGSIAAARGSQAGAALVTVIEVAESDYEVRDDLAGYAVRLDSSR